MIKRITTFSLPEGTNPDDFWAYWSGSHAEKFKKMPHLKGYAVNRVIKTISGEAGFWGMIETWFDSEDDMAKTFSSPEMKELGASENFFAKVMKPSTTVIEEYVALDHNKTKND